MALCRPLCLPVSARISSSPGLEHCARPLYSLFAGKGCAVHSLGQDTGNTESEDSKDPWDNQSWDSAGEGLGVSKNQVPSHYAGRELSCHGRPLGLDNEDPGQGNAKHCISTLSFVAARAPCKDQPHCYYSQWPQDKPTLSSHLRLGLILLEQFHDGNDHEHLPGQDPSGVFWCLRPRRLVCHCCVDLPSELAHSPI